MIDCVRDIKKEALALHKALKGKISITNKIDDINKDNLSLLYSPGVAHASMEIAQDESKLSDYTWTSNTVAVISNGTAVLGLGDIGAKGALPVMEGKALLFKTFADVNAVPLVIDTQDPDEVIRFCEMVAPTFGGINLEDIKAPECVYIEETLKERLNIPVFHDDQHGTAIVVVSGLINAYRLKNKDIKKARVVISGTGAAGSSIIKMLHQLGIENIYAYNKEGVLSIETAHDDLTKGLLDIVKPSDASSLSELVVDKDVFIGVSAANILNEQDIQTMAKDPVVFALANPDPEIPYDVAKKAGACIVATGRSDYPNQINNVLAFPGIFKGALRSGKTQITENMKLSAAKAIAHMIKDEDLKEDYIIPNPFDLNVAENVASAVECEV